MTTDTDRRTRATAARDAVADLLRAYSATRPRYPELPPIDPAAEARAERAADVRAEAFLPNPAPEGPELWGVTWNENGGEGRWA